MPYPIHPDKHLGQSVLTPEAMIAYRRRSGMLPDAAPPRGVILCLQHGLPERMKRRHPLRRVGRMMGDLYLLKRSGGSVAVAANFGIGAPQMASLAEELIAWGVTRLINLSMAGGIQPDLRPGAIVVCSQAIRDEGTSYHYLPPTRTIEADADLTGRLARSLQAGGSGFTSGATWTTDGAYKETVDEVRSYQAEGVLTVEMETAALLAVGKVRGVQAGAVFVVGDSLAKTTWDLPEDFGPVERALEAAYAAAIDALGDR